MDVQLSPADLEDNGGAPQNESSEAVEKVLVNPDLIKLLFQHLPAVEICRFSCVAAPWKVASSSDDLWTDVSFLDTAATFEQVLAVGIDDGQVLMIIGLMGGRMPHFDRRWGHLN
ncbi:MAG: hypothetical protein WDW36_008730 [Sanguina aurantia]